MRSLSFKETLRAPFRATTGFFGAIRFAVLLSLAGKAVGYGRQILIAYYFGLARRLDIYYMTYAIATVTILAFSSLFDQIAVPHLVRTKEQHGEGAFRALSGSVFSFSIVFGLLLTGLFIATIPVTSWIMAHGFTAAERLEVRRMAWYFLPWTLLSMPAAALGAICKSNRRYSSVLLADFLVSLTATLTFIVWHSSPRVLPLTFAAGYAASTIWLRFSSRRFAGFIGSLWTERMRPIYRNFIELFTVNQFSTLSSVVSRFFQSYLLPGSISAFAIADQTIVVLSDFLTFKELFIVPLSSTHQRREKLERLVLGLILVSAPIALFLATEAHAIIAVMYQRGHFDRDAAELTASVFRIISATLVTSIVGLALYRMFQVMDKIRYAVGVQFVTIAATAALAPLFLFYWRLDAVGWALVSVVASALALVAEYLLLRMIGLSLSVWRIIKYAVYSVGAGAAAAAVVRAIPLLPGHLANLAIHGAIYFGILILLYWPIRGHLDLIIYGREAAA